MYAVLHENFISIAVRVYTYIKKEKKNMYMMERYRRERIDMLTAGYHWNASDEISYRYFNRFY